MIGACTAAGGRRHVGRVSQALLLVKLLLLSPTSLPTVAPVPDQVVKQPTVQVKTRSNADREVVEVHTVALLVGEKQAQVAGDSKEEVVVERRKLREGVAKFLGCRLAYHIEFRVVVLELDAQCVLYVLRYYLSRKLAQPGLEHAANGVRIIQLLFREQVDVKLCIELLARLLSISNESSYLDRSGAASV